MTIHPVILCGGSGTRLWPVSRKSYPKQFSSLVGGESLFQQTVRRLGGEGFGPPVIVTAADFRFIVSDQLAAIGVTPAAILIEPEARNTAPAVAAAALWLGRNGKQGLMLVAPSDHIIRDAVALRAAIASAAAAADAGDLVTFGIMPDRAETGYGYLELEDAESARRAVPCRLRRFVEKPDAVRAAAMVAAGNYLWNAGIFLFSVAAIREAFRTHAPDIFRASDEALAMAVPDLGFVRLDPAAWSKAPGISIDYAIMEKAANLSVLPFTGAWSDLGGWESVWAESNPDGDGVARHGSVTAIDCRDSLLRSEDEEVELVGIGLDDIIAVAMSDAVLVAHKSRAQDVKKAVAALKEKKARQAESFPRDHRPWGWFESLAIGDRFQVKRIVVHPGDALSLQSHVHRAEHWIVVAGTAEVTIGEEVRLVTENQSVYIPLGVKHRLANPGKLPLTLIEVQTGGYLGEDDIKRYEDIYARS